MRVFLFYSPESLYKICVSASLLFRNIIFFSCLGFFYTKHTLLWLLVE